MTIVIYRPRPGTGMESFALPRLTGDRARYRDLASASFSAHSTFIRNPDAMRPDDRNPGNTKPHNRKRFT
jgi:hypothetical protein